VSVLLFLFFSSSSSSLPRTFSNPRCSVVLIRQRTLLLYSPAFRLRASQLTAPSVFFLHSSALPLSVQLSFSLLLRFNCLCFFFFPDRARCIRPLCGRVARTHVGRPCEALLLNTTLYM
jgi:hypothetical protein